MRARSILCGRSIKIITLCIYIFQINENGDVDADAMSDAISMVIDDEDDVNRIVNACKDVGECNADLGKYEKLIFFISCQDRS